MENKSGIVFNILQSMQAQLNKDYMAANRELVNNADEIAQVISWLSDNASKQQYMTELAYLSVKAIAPKHAEKYSPFSWEQYQENFQKAQHMLRKNIIPDFKLSTPTEESARNISIVEVFVTEGYRYQDIFKIEENEIFVDCGAYIGDTAVWAYRNGAARVYAFEPCERLFKVLKDASKN